MMLRLVRLGLLLSVFGVLVQATAKEKGKTVPSQTTDIPSTLIVLSANLHVAAGIDPVPATGLSRETVIRNLDLLADLFRSREADVIALQEVDFSGRRTGEINQANYLAEKLGMYAAEAVALDTTGYRGAIHPVLKDLRYGIALLSRFPLQDIRRVTLSDYPETDARGVPNERRVALIARVGNRPDAPLVCSLHLDAFSAENRSKQLGKLVQTLLPFSQGQPVIVAGDFNEPMPLLWTNDDIETGNTAFGYPTCSASEKALELADKYQWFVGQKGSDPNEATLMWNHWKPREDLALHGTFATFPAGDPLAGLDHVFVMGEVRISRTQPVDSQRLSDHRFVEAVIDLTSQPQLATDHPNASAPR